MTQVLSRKMEEQENLLASKEEEMEKLKFEKVKIKGEFKKKYNKNHAINIPKVCCTNPHV